MKIISDNGVKKRLDIAICHVALSLFTWGVCAYMMVNMGLVNKYSAIEIGAIFFMCVLASMCGFEIVAALGKEIAEQIVKGEK